MIESKQSSVSECVGVGGPSPVEAAPLPLLVSTFNGTKTSFVLVLSVPVCCRERRRAVCMVCCRAFWAASGCSLPPAAVICDKSRGRFCSETGGGGGPDDDVGEPKCLLLGVVWDTGVECDDNRGSAIKEN